MVGSRRASMVLPAPGGPMSRRLCAPAAATSSAAFGGRLAPDVGEIAVLPPPLRHERWQVDDVGGRVSSPWRCRQTSARVRAPRTASPSTTAASGTFSAGRIRPRQPAGSSGERHRQGAANGTEVALEANFADQHEASELGARVGRWPPAPRRRWAGRGRSRSCGCRPGQVDGDPLERQREPCVGQRRLDPLAAFADRPIRQSDRGEGGRPLLMSTSTSTG